MFNTKRDLSSDKPDIPVGMPTKPFITNPFDNNPYRDQMPTKAMLRPGFGKGGKAAKIQINSHAVLRFPTIEIFQYDVSALS